MKDDCRNKSYDPAIVLIALKYFYALLCAENTRRTLNQLLEAYYKATDGQNAKAQMVGRPLCPMQLMHYLAKREEDRKRFYKPMGWLFTGGVAFAAIAITTSKDLYPSATWLPMFITSTRFIIIGLIPLACFACAMIVNQHCYKKIVAESFPILFDFLDSLEAIKLEFDAYGGRRLCHDVQFADMNSLQEKALKSLVERAKWQLLQEEQDLASIKTFRAKRLFSATHAALLRIGLARQEFDIYFELAQEEIKKARGEGSVAAQICRNAYEAVEPASRLLKKNEIFMMT